MAEKLVDVVAKLRQRGKKDQPPKLPTIFFFLKSAKNVGRSDDDERRKKKGGWP